MVESAGQGAAPIAKIAEDLGISGECLRDWLHLADAEENGGQEQLIAADKKELPELRRLISPGRTFFRNSVPARP